MTAPGLLALGLGLAAAAAPVLVATEGAVSARGPRLPLEQVIQMQTADTAALFGLEDRGRLAEGYLADVNLIDLEALTLEAPRMIHDLPAGGRRYMQGAGGYRATIKSGQVVMRDGEGAGPLPGRLLRGRQAAPG